MKRFFFWALLLIALFPIYQKIGKFGASIYAELKFDEIRFGPHETIDEIDATLSWFRSTLVNENYFPPTGMYGASFADFAQIEDATFVAYYIREFGFIVVFDRDGKKVGQIKTDV